MLTSISFFPRVFQFSHVRGKFEFHLVCILRLSLWPLLLCSWTSEDTGRVLRAAVMQVTLVLICALLLEMALGFFQPADVWAKRRLLHRSRAVALTREQGANGALRQLLCGVDCVELPCLEFADLMSPSELGASIPIDELVLLTSPQAAKVFLRGWAAASKPPVKIVSVGKGTTKQLLEEGLRPEFEPSQALGAVLAKELPTHLGKRPPPFHSVIDPRPVPFM